MTTLQTFPDKAQQRAFAGISDGAACAHVVDCAIEDFASGLASALAQAQAGDTIAKKQEAYQHVASHMSALEALYVLADYLGVFDLLQQHHDTLLREMFGEPMPNDE